MTVAEKTLLGKSSRGYSSPGLFTAIGYRNNFCSKKYGERTTIGAIT
jgi:hypothetical protein